MDSKLRSRVQLFLQLLLVIFSVPVFSTAQVPDRLLLEGKHHELHTNPLEQYYENHPDRHPREADGDDLIGFSSALWRGYVATFEVIEGELRLNDFQIENDSVDTQNWLVSKIDRYFPTSESRRLLWYSGILVLPTGKMKQYIHLSYASEYGSYTLLRVQKGRVTSRAELTHEEFQRYKRKQFEVYRTTSAYQEFANEIRSESDSDVNVDSFIFNYGAFVEQVFVDFSEAKSGSERR